MVCLEYLCCRGVGATSRRGGESNPHPKLDRDKTCANQSQASFIQMVLNSRMRHSAGLVLVLLPVCVVTNASPPPSLCSLKCARRPHALVAVLDPLAVLLLQSLKHLPPPTSIFSDPSIPQTLQRRFLLSTKTQNIPTTTLKATKALSKASTPHLSCLVQIETIPCEFPTTKSPFA